MYSTEVYSQAGGLWAKSKVPINFGAVQLLKDMATGLGVTSANLDLYSDFVSTLIIVKTYIQLSGSGNKNTNTLFVLLIIMAISCVLSLLPRLFSVIQLRGVMNIPKEKKIQHHMYPNGLYDADGMNVKALTFYGAEIIDHQDYNDKENPSKKALKNREQVISRMFLFAENGFIPMIFPPETNTFTAASAKEDLKAKLKATIAKVSIESIPQALCQFYLIRILGDLGCNDKSLVAIYVSLIVSISLGTYAVLDGLKKVYQYRMIAAKIFVKKHLSTKEAASFISVTELTHEDMKIIAEYFMKKPHCVDELNIEKGNLVGYNPKIKIVAPKNVDKEFLFKVRLNFTPSYVQIKDEKDQQILVDFLSAFPKVQFNKGWGFGYPASLDEKLKKLPNVTFKSG
jgi:hypothetical protein